MKKILIWDIPLRIFHWAFAICITAALIISLTVDDDSPIFVYHMLCGLTAGFLLVLRILIGLIGTRYSKLKELFFNPAETIKYLGNAISGKQKYYAGHNPGTAAAAVIMFLMIIGLLVTGLNINTEIAEDIHPLFAYILLAAISSHLLGLILFTIRKKENISLSIITGKKNGPDNAEIKTARGMTGFIIILLLAGWTVLLNQSYNETNSTLTIPFTDKTIILGEDEEDEDKNEIRNYDYDDDID